MNLLPCAWKQLLGISCPFCGFQRAVFAVVQGRSVGFGADVPAAVPAGCRRVGFALFVCGAALHYAEGALVDFVVCAFRQCGLPEYLSLKVKCSSERRIVR